MTIITGNITPMIGTLGEKSLHVGLKDWLSQPGDAFEVKVDGFFIDIVRGNTLIEIQTRHLYAMKRKLNTLLADHPVRLIHPIAQKKWIVRETAVGDPISRRKSPKQGQVHHIFAELVRLTSIFPHPNLTLDVVMTHEEEILRDDGKGSWRRKRWSIHDRHLLDVVDMVRFTTAADLLALLPHNLPHPFSNRDLAKAINGRLHLAQQMTYTLREIGALEIAGKQGNSLLYQRGKV